MYKKNNFLLPVRHREQLSCKNILISLSGYVQFRGGTSQQIKARKWPKSVKNIFFPKKKSVVFVFTAVFIAAAKMSPITFQTIDVIFMRITFTTFFTSVKQQTAILEQKKKINKLYQHCQSKRTFQDMFFEKNPVNLDFQ